METNGPGRISSGDLNALLPAGQETKHPSQRYSRSEARLEGVSKICSKSIYSAFDNEKCTEVAWIEYRDVPRSVFDKFDESLGSLLALDHPNLVKYLAGWADRKNKTIVLITEQVTGDLRNWLVKKIEMASKVYVRWIRQLCNAIDYLHKANWVHPDISTSKIYIRGTGELKIGGLAETFFADMHFADKTFQVGIGAPEAAVGIRAGPRQNIYQLGVLALQVFTFHHPYRGMTMPQIVKLQLENQKPPELALLKEKDPLAYDLISRCLEPLDTRILLDDILKHPYLAEDGVAPSVEGVKSPSAVLSPGAQPMIERSFSGGVDAAIQKMAGGGREELLSSTADTLSSASGSRRVPAAVVSSPVTAPVVASSRPQMIKCYLGAKGPDVLCLRVRLGSISTLDELKQTCMSELNGGGSDSKLVLRYRDKDGDLVMIAGKTTLDEVLSFATHLELHPVLRDASGGNLLGF